MKYINFQGHHYGVRIAYNKDGQPRLELIENKVVVYNLTTILSYSQYATFTSCSTYIDIDKYPFATDLLEQLNCKKRSVFHGYDKKHPRNIIEYDITHIMKAQNKELKRDKMICKMIDINDSFTVSTLLISYAVHKKLNNADVYYLVTLDGSFYIVKKDFFVKAVKDANIPVYRQFKVTDDYPKGATYVRWN